ncbi:MAG: type II secretion system protein [Patescibacteria group bacterium]
MKRGFTLLEVVIVLAIFTILAVVISSLYIYHSNLYRIEEAAGDIKMQKTIFIKNFRETAEIAIAVEAERSIDGILHQSSSSTVIFKLPSIDENKNILTNLFDYSVFYKSNKNLYMETEADPASIRKNIKKKISDSADSLVFRYNSATPASASLVGVSLFLTRGTLFKEEISTSARLKNK